MIHLIIFGENHTKPKEIKHINNLIQKLKPDYVLHELLYNDVCKNKDIAKQRLQNCKNGELCDPRLNKDLYKLCYKTNIPFIGIDRKPSGTFEEREKVMINIIKKYIKKGKKKNGIIVVVVGDTHLRTINKPSKFYKYFQNAIIMRSKYKEME